MRHVVDHPDEAAAKGAAAKASVLTAHAPAARADFLRRRLRQIEADRSAFLEQAARADQPPAVGTTRRVVARAIRSDKLTRYPRRLVHRVRDYAMTDQVR